MRLVVFSILFLICSAFQRVTAQSREIPEIGRHETVLIFEKNINPQNILILWTKLNEDCTFKLSSKEPSVPVLDLYWLLDRERYKKVHSMIRKRIRQRIEISKMDKPNLFQVQFTDLKELETDLKEPTFTVVAKMGTSGRCEIKTTMQLGPSDSNQAIELQKIYSETRRSFRPPFHQLKSITLFGIDLENGQSIEKKYLAQ